MWSIDTIIEECGRKQRPDVPLFTTFCTVAAGWLLSFTVCDAQPLPSQLNEISGLARTPSGDYWALSDSGNEPELYRIDPDHATILETRRLPVPNRDWEELTTDAAGRLYIGDFGNNANRRRDLRIYRYDLTDNSLDSILFFYPDQLEFPPSTELGKRFDCEAMIWFRDSLHIFTKSRFKGDKRTHHYVLPSDPGNYVAHYRGSLALPVVITGAALSPDNQVLALCGYIAGVRWGFLPYSCAAAIFLYDFPEGRFLHGSLRKRRLPQGFIARQYESITWSKPEKWLIANERRGRTAPRIKSIRQK